MKRKYRYNEQFFSEWLKKSGHTQREVAAVLGTNNDGILRWTKGDYPKDAQGHKDKSRPREVVPMSADKIVILCNTYDIDITDFFVEDDQNGRIIRELKEQIDRLQHVIESQQQTISLLSSSHCE